MSKVEEKVENLVKPKIEQLGYELYDIEYVKEGKDFFLRIFIDKNNGIDLNDCEKVTNSISNMLDTADYIKGQYFLEVSSPGIERVLRKDKHLKQNIGKKVEIKLFKKDNDGSKNYIGLLDDFNKETITINSEDTKKEIGRKDIAHIKTIYNW